MAAMPSGSRRTNYTLLTQIPDDDHLKPPPSMFSGTGTVSGGGYDSSHSGEKKRNDRAGFDWDLINLTTDQRIQHNRQSAFPASSIGGLQRQSSGSSYGESSISGDYFVPSLSAAAVNSGAVGGDLDGYSSLPDGSAGGGEVLRLKSSEAGGGGGSYSSKSWAQQTEESYQLQLALALRLSSEAMCADDPNLLDPVTDETAGSRSSGSNTASAEALSHRFWANGCLSYFDKVPDGFYLIYGMYPYVWMMCCDLQESGRIPSLELLKAIDTGVESSVEVILIDRRSDPSLRELQNRVHSISCNSKTTLEVVDQLAKLVCNRMGGATLTGEDGLVSMWKEFSEDLKDCLGSVVLPMGSLSVGLCRHRSLLFKILADTIDLPCRIAKGCKYCKKDDASSCLVRFGVDKELLVDLIGNPGCLCDPDSLLNGPSTISISSPLRFPHFRQVEPMVEFRSLAEQYFADCDSLNLVFEDPSIGDGHTGEAVYPKQSDKSHIDMNIVARSPSNSNESSRLPPSKAARPRGPDRNLQLPKAYAQNIISTSEMVNDVPLQHMPQPGHRDSQSYVLSNTRMEMASNQRFDGGQSHKASEDYTLDFEDLVIPWSDLDLKERIGAGSFGVVHRADWNGSDVAVKILLEQDFHPERLNEFLQEVAIMRRLRHPNIVLFMGAVTQPPNLSIVTEYLSRGSLYRLLHKSGAKEALDERRRLSMAYDVAKGMNYLHRRNPPIVHRDLKSPNLLVDRKYTVKVCDFGLSRLKANTFLSSKTAAGTPEWMAPEVLRDERSNEIFIIPPAFPSRFITLKMLTGAQTYLKMATDPAASQAASHLLTSDLNEIGLAAKQFADHVVQLGVSGGLLTTILQWLAFIAAVYLLVLDKTNWRTKILTSLLVPYVYLTFPNWFFGILRGDIGKWVAFVGVVLRLFFPEHFKEYLLLPGSLLLLVVVSPSLIAGYVRNGWIGVIICLAIGCYLLQEHIRAAGGFGKAFTQAHGISNTIGIVLLFVFPVWALIGLVF